MAIASASVENTRAATFDVQYRYYAAGETLEKIVGNLSEFVADRMPTTWSYVRDTITTGSHDWTTYVVGEEPDILSGSVWVDITDQIAYQGSLQYDLSNNSVRWSAQLMGWEFSPSLFDTGRAIACLRKVRVPSVLNDVKVMANFDSKQASLNTGSGGSHEVHIPTYGGGVLFPLGKYERSIQIAASTENLIINPSFELGYGPWAATNLGMAGDFDRTSACHFDVFSDSYSASLRTKNLEITDAYYDHTTSNQGGYYGSCYVTAAGSADVGANVSLVTRVTYTDTTTGSARIDTPLTTEWQRISASVATNGAKTVSKVTVAVGDYLAQATHDFYLDCAQLEYNPISASLRLTPYVDGNLPYGCSWTGAMHGSTSVRASASFAFSSASIFPSGRPGTVALWYKADGPVSTCAALVVSGSDDEETFAIHVKNGQAEFDYGVVGVNGYSGSFEQAEWNHFAMTWNGSTVRGYINGEEVDSYLRSGFVAIPVATCIFIGSGVYYAMSRANGVIDDFFILERALPQSEIQAIVNRGQNECCGNDWQLDWIGAVDQYSLGNPSQMDGRFSLKVCGADASLKKTDAPRISVNSTNIALEEASITVSSTLAIPEMESGKGEFIGTTQNVSAANINDGKMKTLWVSNDYPLIEVAPEGIGLQKISEVFFRPYVGWDTNSWWVEIVHGLPYMGVVTKNRNNEIVYYGVQAMDKDRIVLCGSQQLLDAMGGASRADLIIEVMSEGGVPLYNMSSKQLPFGGTPGGTNDHVFNLDPDNGFFALFSFKDTSSGFLDYVQWGNPWASFPGGTMPGNFIKRVYNWGCGWGIGETDKDTGIDLTEFQNGDTLLHLNDGSGFEDWRRQQNPTLGYALAQRYFEWIKIELPAHETILAEDYIPGSTSLIIEDSTRGWLDIGTGIIEGEPFSYTDRASGSILGVTGITGIHYAGATLFPTNSEGEAQTGWYTTDFSVHRLPGLSNIKDMRAFVSSYADKPTPDVSDVLQTDWIWQYQRPEIKIHNGETAAQSQPVITKSLSDRPDNDRWVRTLLLVIDEMWPNPDGSFSRAKINEITVRLDNMSVENAGAVIDNLGTSYAPILIKYIMANHSWMGSGQFVDATKEKYAFNKPTWGPISGINIGVANIVSSIQDICRKSGCVARWTNASKIQIERDPWWPGGRLTGIEYEIQEEDIRGQYVFDKSISNVTGVAISARNALNEPISRIVVPPGANGSGLIEVADITVSSPGSAEKLAWSIYFQETNTDSVAFEIKGVGDWCRPAQRFMMYKDGVDNGRWIITGVSQEWENNDSEKQFTTTIQARKMLLTKEA